MRAAKEKLRQRAGAEDPDGNPIELLEPGR